MMLAIYLVTFVVLWFASGTVAAFGMVLYLQQNLPNVHRQHEAFWIELAIGQIILGPVGLVNVAYYCWLKPLLIRLMRWAGHTRYGASMKPAWRRWMQVRHS